MHKVAWIFVVVAVFAAMSNSRLIKYFRATQTLLPLLLAVAQGSS